MLARPPIRRRLSRRRALAALALLASVLLGAPAPAAALSVSVSASIIYSYCDNDLPWRGDIPYDDFASTQYQQTKGTVSWCIYWYRLSDSDAYGDYYLVDSKVTWTTTQNYGHYPPDNYAKLQLDSSIAAKDNVKDVDPDHNITLSTNCSADTSFSVGWIFTVGVTERFCTQGQLNLEAFTSTVGRWSSPDVTKTPRWEVAYMLKVGQGAKPLLRAQFTYPLYQIYRDPNTLYWKYTRSYGGEVFSYQVR